MHLFAHSIYPQPLIRCFLVDYFLVPIVGKNNFIQARKILQKVVKTESLTLSKLPALLFVISLLPLATQAAEGEGISLSRAIELAQTNDEWLKRSQHEEARLVALSEGANALPDPTLSIGIVNLPTDGFSFNQEPMTQLKVGATQQFSRGETLELTQKHFIQSAAEQPLLRQNRLNQIAWHTSQIWLDAYQSQASYVLIDETRPLFDKLSEIVSANYATSTGSANQQDVIRAELELARLNDRLLGLATDQQVALARLMQYLYSPHSIAPNAVQLVGVDVLPPAQEFLSQRAWAALPKLINADEQALYQSIANHPLVAALEQRIVAQSTNIDIAQQSYEPQYGINASYALRDDAPSSLGGNSRADFFSVGLSVSLPLYSSASQDAQVSSNTLQLEKLKTEKLLLLRELMANLKTSLNQYQGATERLAIYQQQILPQMSQQADAALNAYTNDKGNFAEVVRARIAELDAQVTAIQIKISVRKALAAIDYYLAAADSAASDGSNGAFQND